MHNDHDENYVLLTMTIKYYVIGTGHNSILQYRVGEPEPPDPEDLPEQPFFGPTGAGATLKIFGSRAGAASKWYNSVTLLQYTVLYVCSEETYYLCIVQYKSIYVFLDPLHLGHQNFFLSTVA